MDVIRSWDLCDLPRWYQVLLCPPHDSKAGFFMGSWCKPSLNLPSWENASQRARRAKFLPDASLQSKEMMLPNAKPGCVPSFLFQVSGFSEEPGVKRKSFS